MKPDRFALPAAPEAAIFDWDDTLIDSQDYYRRVYERTFERMREEKGIERLLPLSYADKGAEPAEDFLGRLYPGHAEEALRIHNENKLNPALTPELKPGALELLDYLHERGIPTAIFSDTPQAILDKNVGALLGGYFPELVKVGRKEGAVPKKPDPSGILAALARLEEQHGRTLSLGSEVLMIGDMPAKDGGAAANAGVGAIIIPNGDIELSESTGRYDSLKALRHALDREHKRDLYRPRFVRRHSYAGVDREETEIISGDKHFIESPTTQDTEHRFSEEETALHNKRWIAKKAKNLDGTGHYTQEDQMRAAYDVVEELLTPGMLDKIAARVVKKATSLREEPDAPETITVHLPMRIVNPRKPVENMLSVAYNHELAVRLQERFDREYPGLNVRFHDESRILASLSIQKSAEMEHPDSRITLHSLTGHDATQTVTLGRSTGNLLERIVKQPVFDYSDFKKGDLVILTDDHVQAGGTFISWWHALKERGVDVLAVTALSVMPESKNLQAAPEAQAALHESIRSAAHDYCEKYPTLDEAAVTKMFARTLDKALSRVGLSLETLSSREALTVTAYLVDGRKPGVAEWYADAATRSGADLEMVERADESLKKQLMENAITPMELASRIERMLPVFEIGRAPMRIGA